MLKEEIRKLYFEKRKALSPEESKDFNLKINNQFDRFLPENLKNIHIYLSIASKLEIDTWSIIEDLWAENKQVVVPVMQKDRVLKSVLFTPETKVLPNAWKVPEPVDGSDFDIKKIDAVVVPLLACDMNGFRVGYGKGYYDGFLATLSPDVLKIGLSFFHPIKKIDNLDAWDIPLHYCICPDKVFSFL